MLATATATALLATASLALGTAHHPSGGATVVGDGARYVAWAANDHTARVYDAARRRTFSLAVPAPCAEPALADASGRFLFTCGFAAPDAVVIDAPGRRAHPIAATGGDGSATWVGVGPRYAAYQAPLDADCSFDCEIGAYVVDWRTGANREARRGERIATPRPPGPRLTLDATSHGGGELWLENARADTSRRLSANCWPARICTPALAGGWVTWVEGFDPPHTVKAFNIATGRRRAWAFGPEDEVEVARAGRTVVVASGRFDRRRRTLTRFTLPARGR